MMAERCRRQKLASNEVHSRRLRIGKYPRIKSCRDDTAPTELEKGRSTIQNGWLSQGLVRGNTGRMQSSHVHHHHRRRRCHHRTRHITLKNCFLPGVSTSITICTYVSRRHTYKSLLALRPGFFFHTTTLWESGNQKESQLFDGWHRSLSCKITRRRILSP